MATKQGGMMNWCFIVLAFGFYKNDIYIVGLYDWRQNGRGLKSVKFEFHLLFGNITTLTLSYIVSSLMHYSSPLHEPYHLK